jgi:hypothetical protein
MREKIGDGQVWVAVKVVRGYVVEAKIFKSRSRAQRVRRAWQARLNPDYDESAVVSARIS